MLFFLNGCLSVGSGSLNNVISIPYDNTKKKYKLPKGYCLDRSASLVSSSKETLVITNCIAVGKGSGSYFSRRPVDTIIKVTFTHLEVPEIISQKEYLSLVAENGNLRKSLAASSKRKIVFSQKRMKNKLLVFDFELKGPSKRQEYVRKYFFFVNEKLTIMTVLSFKKSRKST